MLGARRLLLPCPLRRALLGGSPPWRDDAAEAGQGTPGAHSAQRSHHRWHMGAAGATDASGWQGAPNGGAVPVDAGDGQEEACAQPSKAAWHAASDASGEPSQLREDLLPMGEGVLRMGQTMPIPTPAEVRALARDQLGGATPGGHDQGQGEEGSAGVLPPSSVGHGGTKAADHPTSAEEAGGCERSWDHGSGQLLLGATEAEEVVVGIGAVAPSDLPHATSPDPGARRPSARIPSGRHGGPTEAGPGSRDAEGSPGRGAPGGRTREDPRHSTRTPGADGGRAAGGRAAEGTVPGAMATRTRPPERQGGRPSAGRCERGCTIAGPRQARSIPAPLPATEETLQEAQPSAIAPTPPHSLPKAHVHGARPSCPAGRRVGTSIGQCNGATKHRDAGRDQSGSGSKDGGNSRRTPGAAAQLPAARTCTEGPLAGVDGHAAGGSGQVDARTPGRHDRCLQGWPVGLARPAKCVDGAAPPAQSPGVYVGQPPPKPHHAFISGTRGEQDGGEASATSERRNPAAPFRAAELNRLADLPALHSLVPLFPHAMLPAMHLPLPCFPPLSIEYKV